MCAVHRHCKKTLTCQSELGKRVIIAAKSRVGTAYSARESQFLSRDIRN